MVHHHAHHLPHHCIGEMPLRCRGLVVVTQWWRKGTMWCNLGGLALNSRQRNALRIMKVGCTLHMFQNALHRALSWKWIPEGNLKINSAFLLHSCWGWHLIFKKGLNPVLEDEALTSLAKWPTVWGNQYGFYMPPLVCFAKPTSTSSLNMSNSGYT